MKVDMKEKLEKLQMACKLGSLSFAVDQSGIETENHLHKSGE